jgi:heme/copper-type cytochrome/quinol oxidase subunit 3
MEASPALNRKKPAIPNGVLGMVIFIFTEVMLFSGFISAFSIVKAGAVLWPPANQPRLPIAITGVNTCILMLSGALLVLSNIKYRKKGHEEAYSTYVAATALAFMFVAVQGFEWVKLISYGLTLKSSSYGSFFYLIIGAHALHVAIALFFLLRQVAPMRNGTIKAEAFYTLQAFWYFVVGIWPFLYAVVYL